MKNYKNGDQVKFNIGNSEEEGVIESLDHRADNTVMATIRYITKVKGEERTIHRNVDNIQHAFTVVSRGAW
ncbi:Vacuolar ATP synthase subunit [Pseudozyma hubeiensis]|nr:Vacuolar ATP synthase subunit [Pseudozyma hubeiensis]